MHEVKQLMYMKQDVAALRIAQMPDHSQQDAGYNIVGLELHREKFKVHNIFYY